MRYKLKQSALTLTEMVVVIATVALLTAFSLPAIKALHRSFASAGSTQAVISAALSTARAIAESQHRYAGVRFQQSLDGKNQYMVFIINDPNLDDAQSSIWLWKETYAFRAIESNKPIKLPENIGVMDLKLGNAGIPLGSNPQFDNNAILDTTTFSLVFSPNGKLVIRFVPVLRKNFLDAIFNAPSNNPNPMFQDDYDDFPPPWPYQQEFSRNSFVIYEKDRFNQALANGVPWSGYLENESLNAVYINPYTGTMINK